MAKVPAGLVVVLIACPVILGVRVISAPLTEAPRRPVMVPDTLPVEGSWAKANDEIARRTVIAPVHRLKCLKVERAQPVLLDIRLAYLPCRDSLWRTPPAKPLSGHCPVLRKAEGGHSMPGMQNISNQ